MKVLDIYNFLDEFAPFDTALKFDNCGLLVGNKENNVSKVLISLDITKSVVKEAKNIGAELIISHHPIIFNPIKNIDFNGALCLLLKFGINAVCAHTNLDMALKGVNFQLAQRLMLSDLKPLTYEEGNVMGLIGNLEKELSPKEFALYVKNQFGCKGVRYTEINKKIKKVALCSGSGGEFVQKAHLMNADAFVTGEIKHSQILKANELEIMIVDAGHFKTENVITEPLRKELQKNFSDIEFLKSKVFTDKIEYI